MKINPSNSTAESSRESAFTLAEVVVAIGIALFLFVSFYAAMNVGVQTVETACEEVRATQIIVNRMEGIRLFTWNQLTNTTLLPTNFTANYFPYGTNNNGTAGFNYTGTVSVVTAPLTNPAPSYAGNIYQVTITLNWQSFGAPHSVQMSTLCAEYGIQNYVWNNF